MNKEIVNKIFKQGTLAFVWKAYKTDGSIYKQFESINGKLKENLFTEIDKNPETVKKFELVSIENKNKTFSVDLKTGDFQFAGIKIKNNIDISGNPLRCIFWRRKQITVNILSGEKRASYVLYILGWQTTINKINIKKEYIIFPDFSIEEVYHKQHKAINIKAIKE